MNSTARSSSFVALIVLVLVAPATPAWAMDTPVNGSPLAALETRHPDLYAPELPAAYEELAASERTPAMDQFVANVSRSAGERSPRLWIDRRSGRPSLVLLAGVPWVPGSANSLTLEDVAARLGVKGALVDGPTLELIARAYVDEQKGLLGVESGELVLLQAAGAGEDWTVDFGWSPHGVPVRWSHLIFRVRRGNLVQFGMEYIGDAAAVPEAPILDAAQAEAVIAAFLPAGYELAEATAKAPATLEVLPAQPDGVWDLGGGFAYRLAWTSVLKFDGDPGSWGVGVDAASGEVLYFQDLNAYGTVRGDVREHGHSSAVNRPFPFADYRTGPVAYADANGQFPATSSPQSRLRGRYAEIHDGCGPILNDQPLAGDLDFDGLDIGRDCDNVFPQYGLGNTMAARTTYYHATKINRHIKDFLPGNAWIEFGVPANTNFENPLIGYCNAFWDTVFQNLNFLKGPNVATCWNFGEIDSVIYHEFGHGLDQHDGTGLVPTTSEAYADIVAFLFTHDSCMGRGSDVICGTGYGYNCLDGCDGIRQVDYRLRTGGPRTPASTCALCSFAPGSSGPCGFNPHCEAHVATGAVWELATDELPSSGMSQTEAWEYAESLWYQSVDSISSMFSCGGCPSQGAGASVGSLYAALMAADDCDGDQTNGTPHGPEIYSALALHGIAAGSASDSQNSRNDCGGGPEVPEVAITSPQEGATVNGVVPFEATVSYSGSIDRVEFSVDGDLFETDYLSPYSVQWNTLGLPDGSSHTLTVHAVADDGQTGDGDPVHVTVDYEAISVTITAPPDGAHVTGQVSIEAEATGLVTHVEFYVDDDLIDTDQEEPFATTWNTSGLPDGSHHELVAKGHGTGGTDATSPTVSVTIDRDAPEVAVTYPLDGALVTDDIDIQASASASRPITRVEFFVDDHRIGSDTTAPYSYTWHTSNVPDGTQHTIYARAFTSISSGSSSPVHVTFDSTVPAVEVRSVPLDRVVSPGSSLYCCAAVPYSSWPSHEFRIRNVGNASVTLSDFELVNLVGSAFRLASHPSGTVSISPGNYTTFRVELRTDLGIFDGYRARMSFHTNVPGTETFSFDVTGQVFASAMEVRDDTGATVPLRGLFNFGPALLGQVLYRSFTVTSHDPLTWDLFNQVRRPMSVDDFRFTGGYQGREIAPGQTLSYTLEFHAERPDPPLRTAEVDFYWVRYGRPGGGNYDFDVEGLVDDPTRPRVVLEDEQDVELPSDGTFDFGTAGSRCSAERTLTLRNRSIHPVAIGSFTVAGAAYRLAPESTPPEGVLEPGDSVSFTVELEAGGPAGPASGSISFTSDDPQLPTYTTDLAGEVLGTCVPDGTTLCLQDGRLRVRLDWLNHHPGGPASGAGNALPYSERTGFFWFFNPSNVEVVVKALDGRTVNEHFWVFFGGLTDLAYTLEVTDTETGRTASYEKAAGSFCGSSDTHALSDPCDPSNLLPVGVGGVGGQDEWGGGEGEPDPSKVPGPVLPELAAMTDPGFVGTPESLGTCTADGTHLCLLGGRFRAHVDWINQHASGQTGVGHPVPLTDQTGLFWFFAEPNLELALKVVDGRSVNGHFWVFLGALSDVEYTVTLEDTVTGQVRQYYNPPGQYCGQADTAAFDDQVQTPELHVSEGGSARPRGSTVDFGVTLVGQPVSKQLVLTNEGSAALHVASVALGSGPPHFSLAGGGGSFDLLPGGSRDVTVTLTAGAEGDFTGSLVIDSDDSGGPFTVNLHGVVQLEPACVPSSTTLCLQNDRIAVTVDYVDHHNGTSGSGKALEFSDKSGFFWFFNPANVEVEVKVIDGGGVNGHFWVFYGGLTDLAYTLHVRDVVTGTERVYQKAAGNLCGAGDTGALPSSLVGGSSADSSAGTEGSYLAVPLPFEAAPQALGTCTPGAGRLCLLGNRFQIEVDYFDQHNNQSGAGHAVPYNDRTGFFWFFSPSNLELPVKMIDATAPFGHYWLFIGSLSDVHWTVHATDTVTGQSYDLDDTAPFCGLAATALFPED